MNQPVPEPRNSPLSVEDLQRIDAACLDLEKHIGSKTVSIEKLLLPFATKPALRSRGLKELLLVEWKSFASLGKEVDLEKYLARFSDDTIAVREAHTEWQDRDRERSPDSTTFPETSQAEELAQWIHRYREAISLGPQLDPTQWVEQFANPSKSLKDAMAGLEFMQRCSDPNRSQGIQVGDFRILREIGRGGMGVVFEAEQLSLERIVALKILWFGAVSDPEAIRRFQREASTVAKLHHTNIVPIFSVGCEGPINYYAMQKIDGDSLDRILKKNGGPLDWMQVAEWGLQAAEALEHAHRRSVVHRDVKPSNLLLDREGRIWLTDFGLAKRMDDVTLSVAGALLGTPRYMSPEQASASSQRVDHRSDLYSLGASLYELATGRPVFDAESSHALVAQILTESPKSAITIVPGLPRDLNTILMKCLSKKSEERYASARELANDLRALLDGRPISAKRPSFVEHTQLWIRKHRNEFGWSVASIVATSFILIAGVLAWYGWIQLREVKLALTSPNEPVVVEFFHQDHSPAIRPVTVPTQDPAIIAPGSFRMRASAPGLLSQDYQLELNPGETKKLDIHLDDQLLFASETVFDSAIVHSSVGDVLLSYDDRFLTIKSPHQGVNLLKQLQWSELNQQASTPNFIWPPAGDRKMMDNVDKFDLRPMFYPHRLDWNQDGTEDFLVAMKHQAIVSLISSEGSIQWVKGLTSDSSTSPSPKQSPFGSDVGALSTIVAMPLSIGDIDEDGAGDMVVQVAALERNALNGLATPTRFLAALSGRTGELLWKYVPEVGLFRSNSDSQVPYAFRWYYGNYGGTNSSNGGIQSSFGKWSRNATHNNSRGGDFLQIGSVHSSSNNGQIHFAIGSKLLAIEAKDGSLLNEPIDLGVQPLRPVHIAQLDDQPGMDILFLEDLDGQPVPLLPTGNTYRYMMRLVARSLSDGRQLWERLISARNNGIANWWIESPDWPLVNDFDGDGRCEVLVPDGAWSQPVAYPTQGSLLLLSGVNGEPIWKRSLSSADAQIDRFLSVPDIDGDGYNEVATVTMSGLPVRVFVDCLSGKDGTTLWSAFDLVGVGDEPITYFPGRPWLWHSREDGGPQLVVPSYSSKNRLEQGGDVLFFSATTGEVMHRVSRVHRMAAGDFDGDQIDDLCMTRYLQPDRGMSGNAEIKVVRGRHPEQWQSHGASKLFTSDLDQDGMDDTVSITHRALSAYSSKSGKQLWQHPILVLTPRSHIHMAKDRSRNHLLTQQVKEDWDFDRDGVPDLILEHDSGGFHYAPLEAISGKTGRSLWKITENCRYTKGGRVEVVDLDRDGNSEIVWYGFRDALVEERSNRSSFGGDDGHLLLSVFRSIDGSLLWRSVLSREYGSTSKTTLPYEADRNDLPQLGFVDVNLDGVLDVLATGESQAASTQGIQIDLQAMDGKTGHAFWKRPSGESDRLQSWLTASSRFEVASTQSGTPGLAILDPMLSDPKSPGRKFALSWFDPITQKQVWQRQFTVDPFSDANLQNRSEIQKPYVVKRADGSNWIVVCFVLNSQRCLHAYDHQGELKATHELSGRSAYPTQAFFLDFFDCDGDGNDEVILDDGGLQSLKIGNAFEFLTRFESLKSIPNGTSFSVKAQPSSTSAAQLVVIHEGKQTSVEGLDLQTGKRLWTCSGPPLQYANSSNTEDIQVRWIANKSAPLVLFNQGDQSSCFAVDELNAIPGVATPVVAKKKALSLTRSIKPGDPRTKRSLPWGTDNYASQWTSEWKVILTSGLFGSLTLVVLPVWYFKHLASNRRFNLKRLLALPVIVATFLVSFLGRIDSMPGTSLERIGFAIYFAPLVILPYWLFRIAYCLRWKSMVSLVAIFVTVTALMAAMQISGDMTHNPFEENESYSLDGWGWILVDGLFATCWIWFVFDSLQSFATFVWKRPKLEPTS